MKMQKKLVEARVAILAWFAVHKRDLPWRRTNDPWLILVSEIMLQQTQTSRVAMKFIEFAERWPTPRAFAHAGVPEVLAFWSGLGYNRRALNLHRAAAVIVERFGGEVPRSLDELRSLPGVGAYTAGAIMAFARNGDGVFWDTNIRRIAARLLFGGEFSSEPPTDEQLTGALAAMLPSGNARGWYAALMDFGSAVCTGRAPKCGVCPLAAMCAAAPSFRDGSVPQRRLVKPQTRFAGSRRQARGAVLRVLATETAGSAAADALAERLRQDGVAISDDGVRSIARDLAREGFVVFDGNAVSLRAGRSHAQDADLV